MGFSFTLTWWIWFRVTISRTLATREKVRKLQSFFSRSYNSDRFGQNDSEFLSTPEETATCKSKKQSKLKLEINTTFDNQSMEDWEEDNLPVGCCENVEAPEFRPEQCTLCSLVPKTALHDAAIKLQKFYKSYRIRRNLADCAIVAEELWWKAVDFASLKHSSITFFHDGKSESALSKWARARVKAAKVGKGLLKSRKAQKLALQHWLEAIDPRHRYGHNLHLYYDIWLGSSSTQPFFYWLDIGEGKEINLEKCPRSKLQQECVKYLGPKERQSYEVIAKDGKLVYNLRGNVVDTPDDSKWIFVLSTSRALFVGQKRKGMFHHSSFLSGGATIASGRLVVKEGLLKAIWSYSGHYRPTEENFREFLTFLKENNIDLTDVQTSPLTEDDESSFLRKSTSVRVSHANTSTELEEKPTTRTELEEEITGDLSEVEPDEASIDSTEEEYHGENEMEPKVEMNKPLHRWTSGVGPRIRCMRDYPTDLQFKALEHVNLSPRHGLFGSNCPIPSPRPSSMVRLSPRLSLPVRLSPRLSLPLD